LARFLWLGLLQLLDVRVHAVESIVPDVPVLLGPARYFGERGGVEFAGTELGVATASDEPIVFEHFDVLGDCGKGEIERGSEIVHARLAVNETGKDRSAGRVRQSRECLIEPCIVKRRCRHQYLFAFRST
jgi:hypothetical protein